MFDVFTDYTLRTVALGAGTIGIVSGALGSFAVLRRQSLLGDTISHAALPGIVLAFVFTGSKASLTLTLGAALAGFAATLCVMGIVRGTRVKIDAALAIVLAVFFGAGLLLLTWVQSRPDARQAGLDSYLFGQASALVQRDVITIAVIGAVALALMLAFWNHLKVLTFDADFGATLGLPMRAIDVLVTGLLVVAIVVGLQAVGVVLMTAMVVAPAAAARQWTDRLGVMVAIAGLIGAAGGVTGAIVSAQAARLPAGPTIVVCLTALVVISLVAAPRRGLLASRLRERRRATRLQLGAVLADLAALASAHAHADAGRGHSADVLRLAGGAPPERALAELERRGWAKRSAGGWTVTEAGQEEARSAEEGRT